MRSRIVFRPKFTKDERSSGTDENGESHEPNEVDGRSGIRFAPPETPSDAGFGEIDEDSSGDNDERHLGKDSPRRLASALQRAFDAGRGHGAHQRHVQRDHFVEKMRENLTYFEEDEAFSDARFGQRVASPTQNHAADEGEADEDVRKCQTEEMNLSLRRRTPSPPPPPPHLADEDDDDQDVEEYRGVGNRGHRRMRVNGRVPRAVYRSVVVDDAEGAQLAGFAREHRVPPGKRCVVKR